jgi:radical S-adenosyl methionine domain-containing protein 2
MWENCKSKEIYRNNNAVNNMLDELSKKDVANKMIDERITNVRINFAGGEPLLLGKRFILIVKRTKEMGFETSIITNGYLIDKHPEIVESLDMIGISVDSLDENICKKIGRCLKTEHTSGENYLSLEKLTATVSTIRQIKPTAKIKFNIVVNEYNYDTNIAEQLQVFKPDRLKVLRQLPFNGEKGISDEQWKRFLTANEKAIGQGNVVREDKDDITHSYLMIDPYGRFFQNGNERGYVYSQPIHEVGLERALSQIAFDREKFNGRYGRQS